jgi:hypothetical protein
MDRKMNRERRREGALNVRNLSSPSSLSALFPESDDAHVA